ncbi:hypothetical protein AX15_002904 [Amanita polypyramis BW_CC]|nr:hypothetical protein AX15_002904 [Amanita polypyramis BW_CC]
MGRGTNCSPVLLQFAAFHRWTATSCRASHGSRCYNSSKAKAIDSKAFSKTLLLPKSSFPLRAEPSTSETPYQKRSGEDLYRWQWNNAAGPLFVFHDGPPYANGNLHMGHALNKILKDIINRFHVLLGHKVHYIPGWDCHGLPIENKALEELGKASYSVAAGIVRDAARSTAIREIASQKSQFQPFGLMADWTQDSTTYRTLDHKYEMRQLKIFQKMVEKGLIYRHNRPVHYSPSSRSALAEAELIYKDDHVSHSVYVTFNIDHQASIKNQTLRELVSGQPNIKLLVWTTTPWTLTANMGIAVHPELMYGVVRCNGLDEIFIVALERLEALKEIIGSADVVAELPGAELVGLSYVPLFNSKTGTTTTTMEVIPASHVTAESGTGLVHCAPAHGVEDYIAFRCLGHLSNMDDMICHVDSEGKFSKDVAAVVGLEATRLLLGREVLAEGGKAIVEMLREMGHLVKIKRTKHRYPYDWRTNKPIIVMATSQWFANLDNIKDNALKALSDVSFFPAVSRNRLESFIRSRSEWCISRQRVWGVPIPALYHIDTGNAVLNKESLNHILSILDAKGVEHWWNGPVEDFVPPFMLEPGCSASETWRKGTDTMDVWFDSGTSWSMLSEMGVGKGAENGRKFHADVCLEGSDQHRGWFQSQLLTAIAASDDPVPASPYGSLITHGMVLDQEGKKMSKSLGNIINPLTIVFGGEDKNKDPAYGADVLRLWAASSEYWRDLSIGPLVLSQTAESLRKIRNSARFLLGNVRDSTALARVPKSELGLMERYVMHELYKLEQTALEGYASYNFSKAMVALTNFANITLSSLYFDVTKDCLYAEGIHNLHRRAIVTVFEHILSTITPIMAPVLPHLAEEIHEHWKSNGKSVFANKWMPLSSEWEDAEAASIMPEYLRLRSSVLALLEKARAQKLLRSSLEAAVDLIVPASADKLRGQEHLLKTLFIVSDVKIDTESSPSDTAFSWAFSEKVANIQGSQGEIVLRVHPATLEKCPRCWTFTRSVDEVMCRRCLAVVSKL